MTFRVIGTTFLNCHTPLSFRDFQYPSIVSGKVSTVGTIDTMLAQRADRRSRSDHTLPLVRRTGPAYDVFMFRWLLIVLFVCQTGLPHSGTCCSDNAPQFSPGTCYRVAQPEQVRSCCQTKVPEQVDQFQNLPSSPQSDGGEHRACCGCCVSLAVYCLHAETIIRWESASCDRISEECPVLNGLTWAPLTPPPNLIGVG